MEDHDQGHQAQGILLCRASPLPGWYGRCDQPGSQRREHACLVQGRRSQVWQQQEAGEGPGRYLPLKVCVDLVSLIACAVPTFKV